jgi:propanol-preferring alcohol dehydrogenase
MVRKRRTVALVGLPPGAFPTPIFDVVLKRITIRGSIVDTRHDLDEAIAFAAEGKVGAHCETTTLERINNVLSDLKASRIDGRMVLDLAGDN